jgi:hypothetical protein
LTLFFSLQILYLAKTYDNLSANPGVALLVLIQRAVGVSKSMRSFASCSALLDPSRARRTGKAHVTDDGVRSCSLLRPKYNMMGVPWIESNPAVASHNRLHLWVAVLLLIQHKPLSAGRASIKFE